MSMTWLFPALIVSLFLSPAWAGLRLDVAEAEAVLALAEGGGDWEALWGSEGYRRLQERERSMGRAFENEAFRTFVESAELRGRVGRLREALQEWRRADLEGMARRVMAYLPAEARIEATVYVVIKPRDNSFVFDLGGRPAIFLYLDPEVKRAKFENTVAHELHHVGFASVKKAGDAGWAAAFGEGAAMLAAAGSAEVHPHAVSKAEERARWDADMKNAARDMEEVGRFLVDVANGRLNEKAAREKAMSYFGVQGPWYTVGWLMASTVERVKGRAVLVECLREPGKLLRTYNECAARAGGLPLWKADVLEAVGQRWER